MFAGEAGFRSTATRSAAGTATRSRGQAYGRLRFHDLRHTFGTRMIAKADIRRVQEWMGHADIQTTMKYLHYAAARRGCGASGPGVCELATLADTQRVSDDNWIRARRLSCVPCI